MRLKLRAATSPSNAFTDVKEIESMPVHLEAIGRMKVRSNSDSVYFPIHPGYNMETKDM